MKYLTTYYRLGDAYSTNQITLLYNNRKNNNINNKYQGVFINEFVKLILGAVRFHLNNDKGHLLPKTESMECLLFKHQHCYYKYKIKQEISIQYWMSGKNLYTRERNERSFFNTQIQNTQQTILSHVNTHM
eukprot:TRINITY_DN9389_c1_g1_i1.p4 TRINITY_DN9389_c1_g1~~TRINITY_DN9389_c1_g1_i1.p4  ORF type:complete len:131 (+),score=0.12 TRINITY_DN9389_c1_g1_i1:503-895(+)